MEKQYGKYGERIVDQERFTYISSAVRTYFAAHGEEDSSVIDCPTPRFEKFVTACGIDMEEVEAIAYDLMWAVEHEG